LLGRDAHKSFRKNSDSLQSLRFFYFCVLLIMFSCTDLVCPKLNTGSVIKRT